MQIYKRSFLGELGLDENGFTDTAATSESQVIANQNCKDAYDLIQPLVSSDQAIMNLMGK